MREGNLRYSLTLKAECAVGSFVCGSEGKQSVPLATSRNLKREDQQDATIRCFLLTSVSTCFGHHYAHLQEIKDPVTAFGVLFWLCWMWSVAVVGRCLAGCEHCEGFFSLHILLTMHGHGSLTPKSVHPVSSPAVYTYVWIENVRRQDDEWNI